MDGPSFDPVKPSSVGVDPARLSIAIDVLKRGIDDQAMPGAVICGFRRGKPFVHQALGTLDGTRPNSTDTIYDLASITKPMATASSVLHLLETGRLTLMQTLPALLGQSAAKHATITVGHLLTHTSGFPAHCKLWEKGSKDLDSAVSAILTLDAAPIATKYEYSCLGFILLGKVAELVTGQSLDRFAAENIFAPLQLSVSYRPDESLRSRIAPTKSLETIFPGETTDTAHTGIVNDGNARSMGGVSGNAGLFGTASDVARFGEAIRTNSPKLFGSPTHNRILQNQVNPGIGGHTLMFFAQPNPLCPSGDLLSPRAIGHSGYTGNVLTIDPEHELVIVVLTNRVYWDRDGAKWLTVRRKFLNALAAAL